MLDLTLREAQKAMRADLHGVAREDSRLSELFPSVSIDTRTLACGQSFFAIQGPRFDGHEFAGRAVDSGAAVLVVSRPVPTVQDIPQLVVKDTKTALQQLATAVRQRWGKDLIAITGSMGKTTTREFAAALLGDRFTVLQSRGNLNNEFGLPLSLLELRRHHDVAVLELGMNHPGEIDSLGRLCLPSAAVITNVAPVHLEFFPSVDAIADAKAEILGHLPADGSFFLNGDDVRLVRVSTRFGGAKHTFGFASTLDYRITAWSLEDIASMRAGVAGPGFNLEVRLPCIGRHFLHNLAAAIAVAHQWGIPEKAIEERVPHLQPLKGRGQINRIDGLYLWDDSYNSNPAAVDAVLETVRRLSHRGRIVLVLGEMLELGKSGPQLHREVGQKIQGVAHWLFTVGPLAEQVGEGALSAGFPKDHLRHFESADEAARSLPRLLESGDLVVVKGSRGVRLDKVVAALRGELS